MTTRDTQAELPNVDSDLFAQPDLERLETTDALPHPPRILLLHGWNR